MLVGYDLSGIVRKKVPGAISAGRVQSPALRLVVEREQAIEKFNSKSTFKVSGDFADSKKHDFKATLDKEFESEDDAKKFLESNKGARYHVSNIEDFEGTKANPVPLTTAAMQIEANAKLGFSSRTTMSAAQGLYQAGLITYHRTDSLNLSKQALASIASYIEKTFGKNYLHTRNFKTKDAQAQEAHEAIRPTNIEQETAGKNDYERRLYNLIRSRTLATQMAAAKIAKTTVSIKSDKTPNVFTAKGEVVIFDGFLKVYGKSKDLELPKLAKGDEVSALEITARQNFAKAPARYTEGSLVKKLEELGIGRPSTYASIMSAIQARNYVIKGESEGEDREVIELKLKGSNISRDITTEKFGADKGKLIPAPIGELVTGFLVDNFKNIVDYKFTANIEKDLDLIAEHKLERVKMLKDFYGPFHNDVLVSEGAERYNNSRILGHDPETGEPIYAKVGKNGGFIQLGDNEKESGKKPRFAPLPKRKTVKTVTLEQALGQLALPTLPRSLGQTKDGVELIAASGPFGPYLKAGKYNIPLGKDEDPYTISFETAEALYQAKISSIIADWDDIMIINGAYGPYIKGPGRRNNVRIPKDQDPTKITREQAEEMLKNKPKTSRHAPHRRKAKKATTKATKKKK